MNDLQAAALALLESEMRRKKVEEMYSTEIQKNQALTAELEKLKAKKDEKPAQK